MALNPHLSFFFFNNTAPTEISPLPLHDALPISSSARVSCTRVDHSTPAAQRAAVAAAEKFSSGSRNRRTLDRKSTRLNSSHLGISYAVFCFKKKTQEDTTPATVQRDAVRRRRAD